MNERIEFNSFTNMSKYSNVNFKNLINYARKLKQNKIAITDYNGVEIFPKIEKYLKDNNINDIKVIYGVVVKLLVNEWITPITIIVRNQKGLSNLYKIITNIKTINKYKYHEEVITKEELVDLSDGLLYGLDINYLEIIYDDLTNEQIVDDMMWYDFIIVRFDEEKKEYLKKIINLARKYRKMVIATGNVHYLHKEEKEEYLKLFPQMDKNMEYYLRSTKEMQDEFKFLDNEELINDIVINLPNKLASLIDDIKINDDKLYLPKIKNSKQKLIESVYKKAKELYGENLPLEVEERIKEELYGKLESNGGIINQGYETIYLIYKELVDYSHSLGYPVYPRGAVASSFVAYLLGLTNINPLKSHYICSKCKHSIFDFKDNKSYDFGINCPDKECPQCQSKMKKDGYNISCETFLGYDMKKVPNIDMNFAYDIQKDIQNYLQKMFKTNHVLTSSVIGYKNLKKVKGILPGGFIVIPDDEDIYKFMPIEYPNNQRELNWKSTHFDYHDIKNLYKFDILAHETPSIVKKLEDKTNVKSKNIPLDDKETIELINNRDFAKIKELDNEKIRNILKKIKINNLEELVKIMGYCHIEGINNDFKDLITNKDDMVNYLIKHNIDEKKAYEITNNINSKNKELFKNELMNKNIDEWFIDFYSKVIFLLPKSHVVGYVINAFRLAWYKKHYPSLFEECVKEL